MLLPIKGYPNYTISDKGIIYNGNGLALLWHYREGFTKTNHRHNKHPRVTLYRKNKPKQFQVHRLVALHFVPNPENKPIVHHKDNNVLNPSSTNLEWVTNSQNMQKAYDDGLISLEKKSESAKKGGDNLCAVPVRILHKQTKEEKSFPSIRDLQIFLGKKYTTSIHQAIREPQRTVKGYYIKRN